MRKRISFLASELWLPIALVTSWWFLSVNSTSFYLPSLQTITAEFADFWFFDGIRDDLAPSMLRFGVGYFGAAFFGIVFGVVLGLWKLARRALNPLVDFLRAMPGPALISIGIIVLGFRDPMKMTVIAFTAFFPVLISTTDGVRAADPVLLDMTKAYRLSRFDRIVRVILPAASPQIFAGLRVSLAVALTIMVFSEMLAGTNGLGFLILFSQETYAIPKMWSGLLMLGIVGYVVNLLFLALERRVLGWHKGRAATAATGGRGGNASRA